MSTYYTNGEGKTELTQKVLDLIRNSKRYIKTANFLFQDKMVIDCLKERMEEGIPLFVISNLRDPEESGQKPSEEGGIVVDMHLPNLNELVKLSAHCHFLDELHAKFILIDGSIGIIMSANYTENSLGKNIETGLIIEGEEVKELEYVFDKLYTNADVQKFEYVKEKKHVKRKTVLIPADSFDDLHSRIRLTICSPEDKQSKKSKKTNLSSCKVTTIYESIVSLINEAQEFVIIVSWHFRALNKIPDFVIAVKQAIHRGVKVSLYSNCLGQSTSLNASLEAINELESLGCVSYGDDNNHSKCVVNERGGIIFTANIDGVHGMNTGFEVGCMLNDEQHCDVVNHVLGMINRNK